MKAGTQVAMAPQSVTPPAPHQWDGKRNNDAERKKRLLARNTNPPRLNTANKTHNGK